MAAISGFAEQCRKMNAIRLGGPFGLSVHGEKQLIGKEHDATLAEYNQYPGEGVPRSPTLLRERVAPRRREAR
jgi:hypothetical protein